VVRTEQDIFADLAALCIKPGYIHAIACLSFRDNAVDYADQISSSDLHWPSSRLIRTELMTLIGLMVKSPIDYTLPCPDDLNEYVIRSDKLLGEMHRSLSSYAFSQDTWQVCAENGDNPFRLGQLLREPIFYGGESAYSFQYRDFAIEKYIQDDTWLKSHKGFSIAEAREVINAISHLQNQKLMACFTAMRDLHPGEWTVLPGLTFTAHEAAQRSGVNTEVVDSVLASFACPSTERNVGFNALDDFNITNALPLIAGPANDFILFHPYSLVEALYEAPFYWMGADPNYSTIAMRNRGKYTEELARDRLTAVFGKRHVHTNVDIFQNKSKKLAEVDVLVLFGDRAIVVQAKSKRLTLESRKGNDLQIKEDFKKSVQNAYDQGFLCATHLNDSKCKFVDADGQEITLSNKIAEIYILCVVSDHYPALSFQSRQFLQIKTVGPILPPFVLDVFTLDTIAEMLNSPLRFLSYLRQRSQHYDRMIVTHELSVLSYHLKFNLCIDDKVDLVSLEGDLGGDLDIAMATRRDGLDGIRTPDGILTRFAGTMLARLIEDIEKSADPALIGLGFIWLNISEESFFKANEKIEMVAAAARLDGKPHDITVGIGEAGSGFTVHINDDSDLIAETRLTSHCQRRKYSQKAHNWFGVCINTIDSRVRFGIVFAFPWAYDTAMESVLMERVRRIGQKANVGRNDPCPCGSGRKYKKCCLGRVQE